MENKTDQQDKMLDIINRTAEQLGMDIAEMAPFETEKLALFIQKAAAGNEHMSDEDLISITIEGINSTQLEDDASTEETEAPVVEDEAEHLEETTENIEEDITAIATKIVTYLELNERGATKRKIEQEIGVSKESVATVVDELLQLNMVHKINKTVLYGPAPEADTKAETEAEVAEVETEVEKILVIDVEDNEPLAEKTNNMFENALTQRFDDIRELFITELNTVETNAEADSGYKSQAEQYTEVMADLRNLLDELQREQGWILASPAWQRVSRIAEWHPEA